MLGELHSKQSAFKDYLDLKKAAFFFKVGKQVTPNKMGFGILNPNKDGSNSNRKINDL